MLKTKYGSLPGYYLLDPIYEPAELNMLRSNCSLYVHGHSAGGTNPSLVEAMYLGLPVLCFDVTYNRATTEESALYFKDADSLRKTLGRLSALNLLAIGIAMKTIADREYTWKKIARSYAYLIRIFEFGYARKPVSSKWSRADARLLARHGLAHLKQPIPFFEG
jgi:glycosyltransferase involved in cell wall biosynthesis